MCFQAVCKLFVPILRVDGSIVFFLFKNFVFPRKLSEHFVFIPSNLSCLYLSFHASRNLCVFFGRSRRFRCCVNFFIICWLLSFKEGLQWALHLFPFWLNLAHVLIYQRKIDMDLQNEKLPSCILQCILFQVEPRLSFVSRFLKRFGMIQKKITFISQIVITLLVQRTSGEEKYSFSEFFTRFGRVDKR